MKSFPEPTRGEETETDEELPFRYLGDSVYEFDYILTDKRARSLELSLSGMEAVRFVVKPRKTVN